MEQPSDVIVGKRGAKITKKWNPKDWKPIYEAMVALCTIGKRTQREVALEFGYTEAWLSQIMNSEKGKEVQRELIRNTRDRTVGDVASRLRDIQELALQRMETVIRDDKIAERSPLAIFDRSALFLKNTGVIKDSHSAPVPTQGNVTNITQHNNTLIVSGKSADSLRAGLKKANEVQQLHSEPIVGSLVTVDEKKKVVNG